VWFGAGVLCFVSPQVAREVKVWFADTLRGPSGR
jgi:hypothetical protein